MLSKKEPGFYMTIQQVVVEGKVTNAFYFPLIVEHYATILPQLANYVVGGCVTVISDCNDIFAVKVKAPLTAAAPIFTDT